MWVIVLNDGSTYTTLEGSHVLWVPPVYEGDNVDRYVEDAVGVKGIPLAITESIHSPLSGDIYVPNLVEIEMGMDTSFTATIYRNLIVETAKFHTHSEIRRLAIRDLTITKVTKMVDGQEVIIFSRQIVEV